MTYQVYRCTPSAQGYSDTSDEVVLTRYGRTFRQLLPALTAAARVNGVVKNVDTGRIVSDSTPTTSASASASVAAHVDLAAATHVPSSMGPAKRVKTAWMTRHA